MKLIKFKRQSQDARLGPKISLSRFVERWNRVLVVRRWGGLGDIVNTRPIFKTIKTLYPFLGVDYALPRAFHDAVSDSIYVDNVLDVDAADLDDYGYVVDISHDCKIYEEETRPRVDKHRSDIWAEKSIGLKLVDHDYHFRLDPDLVESMGTTFDKVSGGKATRIGLVPTSADISRSMAADQWVEFARGRGDVVPILERDPGCGVSCVAGLTVRELIHLVAALDYLVTVDTGPFHLAAAFAIPTFLVCSWTDPAVIAAHHPKALWYPKRSRADGVCPCYDWPRCEWRVRPLPCSAEMTADVLAAGLDELTEKFFPGRSV